MQCLFGGQVSAVGLQRSCVGGGAGGCGMVETLIYWSVIGV